VNKDFGALNSQFSIAGPRLFDQAGGAAQPSIMDSYWNNIPRHWARLGPPVRPTHEVVSVVSQQIAAAPGKVLLLGVTPELAGIGADVTAVDRNANMIKYIWPGDSAGRRSRNGDWRDLQFGGGLFASCVGDGSLNVITYPDDILKVFRGVSEVLRPGGRFVCRLYLTPDRCESPEEVRIAAMEGGIRGFHALKWRVAMATAAAQGNANIRVTAILDSFERLFPERNALSLRCGWTDEIINTIDAYRNSAEIYCFPTAAEIFSLMPPGFAHPRLVDVGGYELAERCPLLVMDRV